MSQLPVAILSDIHANIEALRAVLADIDAQGIHSIINLGDTIGYGPDPAACIDLVQQRCTLNICGNHDYAVLHDAEGFNPIAYAAVEFARQQLKPSDGNPDRQRRWAFLRNLDPIAELDGFEVMHGSPRQPITEYVLPSDPGQEQSKLKDIFAAMNRPIAFIGHTHYPGVIEEGDTEFYLPIRFDNRYALSGKRAIINVGSVGQPRDRDIRSCYVVFDGKAVEWRRVAYDVEKTVAKVAKSGGLHEICGLRLREGK